MELGCLKVFQAQTLGSHDEFMLRRHGLADQPWVGAIMNPRSASINLGSRFIKGVDHMTWHFA